MKRYKFSLLGFMAQDRLNKIDVWELGQEIITRQLILGHNDFCAGRVVINYQYTTVSIVYIFITRMGYKYKNKFDKILLMGMDYTLDYDVIL